MPSGAPRCGELPGVAVPHVLRLLPVDSRARAACVAREWRDAAKSPAVWAELDFACCEPGVSVWEPTLLALCARAGAALRSLRVRYTDHERVLPGSVLRALRAGGCSGLQSLTLAHPACVTVAQAQELARICPALRHADCPMRFRLNEAVAPFAVPLPGPLRVDLMSSRDEEAFDERTFPVAAFCEALRANTTVSNLTFFASAMSEAGARALSVALLGNTTLTELCFHSIRVDDAGAAALIDAVCANPRIRSLNLRSTYLGSDGQSALARALRLSTTALTSLNADPSGVSENKGAVAVLDALRVNATLTDLRLGQIGEQAVASLCAVLRGRTALTKLRVETRFSAAGAADFGDALRQNETLENLDLAVLNGTYSYFDMQAGRVVSTEQDDVATALARGLRSNAVLKTLWLSMILCADGASALRDALRDNTTLTDLMLRQPSAAPELADYGAMLAQVLQANSRLQTLCMFHVDASTAGVSSVWQALKDNTSLKSLTLCHMGLNDQEAVALGDVLRVNSTLTTLNIRAFGLSEHGWQALFAGLRANRSLVTLDALCTQLDDSAVAALGAALRDNTALRHISLNTWRLTDAGAAAFAEQLRGMRENGSRLDYMFFYSEAIRGAAAAAIRDVLPERCTLFAISGL